MMELKIISVFQPVPKQLLKNANSDNVVEWKPKGLSYESIKLRDSSNNNSAPSLNYIHSKIQVKFNGNFLKQGKVELSLNLLFNIHNVYEINLWSFIAVQDFTLGNSLFGAVKLTWLRHWI